MYDKSVTFRAVAAVRLLTRIRQENPALWSRIESFARGEDEAGSDSGIRRQAGQGSAGQERGRETDAGESAA